LEKRAKRGTITLLCYEYEDNPCCHIVAITYKYNSFDAIGGEEARVDYTTKLSLLSHLGAEGDRREGRQDKGDKILQLVTRSKFR